MRLYITNQKDLKALQDENTELQMQIEECQLQKLTENQFYQDEIFHLNEDLQLKNEKIYYQSKELQMVSKEFERNAEIIHNLKSKLADYEQM